MQIARHYASFILFQTGERKGRGGETGHGFPWRMEEGTMKTGKRNDETKENEDGKRENGERVHRGKQQNETS